MFETEVKPCTYSGLRSQSRLSQFESRYIKCCYFFTRNCVLGVFEFHTNCGDETYIPQNVSLIKKVVSVSCSARWPLVSEMHKLLRMYN